MNNVPAILIDKVNFSHGDLRILEDVSFTVEQGEFIGIVGPSGGGKTTLLKLMLGLIKPSSGKIEVLGQKPTLAQRRIGYVSQYPTFRRDFPISVLQTVLLGRLGITKTFGDYSKEDYEIAHRSMKEVEIDHLADRTLENLSGGEIQRVLLARAISSSPEILMLDEPTANIDMRVEEDIFEVLKRLNQRITIIVVSHDIGFISQYVTKVACLQRTLICHEAEALNAEVIEKLYGQPINIIHHSHCKHGEEH
ncbi:MAG: metal ABC transporter ATP-binding protein [Deltaproteobacteria bacterium]|nr:metal ABC transporter ATP-binding protein [Deltaproteobacteria bacterium]